MFQGERVLFYIENALWFYTDHGSAYREADQSELNKIIINER